jgi:hypothetical protein
MKCKNFGSMAYKTTVKEVFSAFSDFFEGEAEKSADVDQAAAGMRSVGGGTMIPVFWISVWEGSSW